jgi:hypothetical protein
VTGITVACLMPTIPSHAEFLPRARASFDAQVVPEDWNVSLCVTHDEDPTLTLGAKLNKMINACLAADPRTDFFVLLDDDDVHAPHRVQRQVEPLLYNPGILSCSGTSVIVYRDVTSGDIFRYTGGSNWIGGLAFPISSWEKHKFENTSSGVDFSWQKNFPLETRLDLKDESLLLCSIHPANTCEKHTVGREWQQLMMVPESLVGLM